MANTNPKVNQELKSLLQSNQRDHFLDPKAPFYVAQPDGLLVCYQDSQLIHTEGSGYASYLLCKEATLASQKLFDSVHIASNNYFPHLQNSSILAWNADDDDSATDGDVFRIQNMYQAYMNQRNKNFGSSALNYLELSKVLNNDFLQKEVIYCNNLAIPLAGINDLTQSNFLKDEGEWFIFQYNPSYSFSYAANLLGALDIRWKQIKNTQNIINELILKTFGIVDWCIVKINKNSSTILITDELDVYFPFRSDTQNLQPSIEWPRFILDQVLNVIKFNDLDSKKMLNLINAKYSLGLTNLKFAGYRNELVIALSTLLKVLFNQLQATDLTLFKAEVFGSVSYYGNKYYNSSIHTFQQLLVGMIVKGLKSILSNK